MKTLLHSLLLATALAAPTPTDAAEADAAKPTPPAKEIWAASFLGKKAPELIVEKWLTPEPKRDGKFVLIDFWATWCGPCREAIPELNTFHRKFGDRLVVIGLSDEKPAAVLAMKDPKIDYASAIDTQARTKKAVRVEGIPHVLLIDPEGIVRWEGFPLLDGHRLTEAEVGRILDRHSKPVAAK